MTTTQHDEIFDEQLQVNGEEARRGGDVQPSEQGGDPIDKTGELERKCQDYLGLAKRARADYENLKKETDRWKEDFVKFAHEVMIFELIPILDHFTEAMMHVPEKDKTLDWVVGLVYIKKQLEDVLKKQGVEIYGVVGEAFDPHFHESVDEVEQSGYTAGQIVKVVRFGYRFPGKILRPAQVVIAK